MSEWISVKDRLPEGLKSENIWENGISKEVFVYMDGYFTAKYFTEIDKWIIPGFTGDWKPTHWMTLPEPPK